MALCSIKQPSVQSSSLQIPTSKMRTEVFALQGVEILVLRRLEKHSLTKYQVPWFLMWTSHKVYPEMAPLQRVENSVLRWMEMDSFSQS